MLTSDLNVAAFRLAELILTADLSDPEIIAGLGALQEISRVRPPAAQQPYSSEASLPLDE